MSDGSLQFDTKIDTSGFQQSLAVLGGNLMTQAVNKVAELGKEALNVGTSFETASSQLAATMGVTKDDITDLINTAKELGASTSFSATEAAEGLNILAQSGLTAEEQMAAIGDVLNLAAAGSLSLADAASYTTGTIKGFGDSMDNARYYADLIAKGATLANTNVNDLGEALSSAAATAGNYGQTADSTALSLLRLAEQNVTGSEAATALNRAMMDLYTPTNAAKSVLEELGVSAYDSTGKARDFNDVVDELNNAMAGMSEEEANATKNAIFTTYGLQAFNKMTVSSTEKVNELKDGLASASDGIGSAAQQAETMLDNLEGQLTIMSSAAEGLGIEIYESFAEPLTNIVMLGTEALGKLTDGFKQGGFKGMATVGFEMVYEVVRGITESASLITVKAGELATFMIASIQSNAPNMLNAAVELIASFARGIGAQLPTLVPQALNMIVTLADALISSIPTIVQAGISILVGLVSGIVKSLPTLIQEGPRIINDFSDAIYNAIGTLLGTGLAMIAELAKGIIKNLPLIIKNAGNIFKAIINIMSLSKMLSLGKSLIAKLKEGIEAVGPAIKQALKNIGDAGFNAIKNISWSQVGNAIITFITSGLKAAGNMILSALKSVGTAALNAFKSISWKDVGRAVIAGIASGITGAVGTIASAAKKAAKSALDSAKNFLGIHSPSTVFRDQVGKYMALGIGVGFKKNIPVKDIKKDLNDAIKEIDISSLQIELDSMLKSLQIDAIGSVSIPTANTLESSSKYGQRGLDMTDWLDEWERKQRKLNKERDSRPIFLGTDRIDRPLPKGAVPAI